LLDIITHSEILSTNLIIECQRDWPEGALYRYDLSGHEILRIVRDIDDELANSVASDPVNLALVIEGPLIVMCSRVGEKLPWAGAAFHWHRVRRSDRILPISEVDLAFGSKIDLRLLDGRRGQVKAVRSLELPPEFSRVLFEAILEQARFNYNPSEERQALKSLLRRCPTPGLMAALALSKVCLP
jgi:hypothetical protein